MAQNKLLQTTKLSKYCKNSETCQNMVKMACQNIAKMVEHVEILYQWLNMSNIVQILQKWQNMLKYCINGYFYENMATKASQCGSLDMSLSESYDLIHEHI